MPSQTSITYSCSSAGPPGKSLWIIGSLSGSVIVMIIVASLLGGSSGLSYSRLEVAAALVEFDQGQLPGAGDAVSLYM